MVPNVVLAERPRRRHPLDPDGNLKFVLNFALESKKEGARVGLQSCNTQKTNLYLDENTEEEEQRLVGGWEVDAGVERDQKDELGKEKMREQ